MGSQNRYLTEKATLSPENKPEGIVAKGPELVEDSVIEQENKKYVLQSPQSFEEAVYILGTGSEEEKENITWPWKAVSIFLGALITSSAASPALGNEDLNNREKITMEELEENASLIDEVGRGVNILPQELYSKKVVFERGEDSEISFEIGGVSYEQHPQEESLRALIETGEGSGKLSDLLENNKIEHTVWNSKETQIIHIPYESFQENEYRIIEQLNISKPIYSKIDELLEVESSDLGELNITDFEEFPVEKVQELDSWNHYKIAQMNSIYSNKNSEEIILQRAIEKERFGLKVSENGIKELNQENEPKIPEEIVQREEKYEKNLKNIAAGEEFFKETNTGYKPTSKLRYFAEEQPKDLIRYLTDTVNRHLEYDEKVAEGERPHRTKYEAVEDGKAVCKGYSEILVDTMELVQEELKQNNPVFNDLEFYKVKSESMNHAWVGIKNGNHVTFIDPTWADRQYWMDWSEFNAVDTSHFVVERE